MPIGTVTDAVLKEAFARFNTMHDEFYGYHLGGETIEIVNLTVTAVGASEVALPHPAVASSGKPSAMREVCFETGNQKETTVFRRATLALGSTLTGPAIIEETDATTLLEPGDTLTVQEDSSLLILVS